ncbi:hypothetical protein [Amycolatopsis alkalitolerans]|uniref:Uncharacterized protein n=1 Tax=Amycolatopsis alkalitolerans TaxID=2547244 RepID=A0A5C4M495_9PSEU|nr:hypothetical protein [Amycolatopsis alkalitolerans]TNC27437.1 hypothetical protein FG385_10255 [Amycolatopsis alkalitolerans]
MSYPLYRRGTFAVIDGKSCPVSYKVGENYVQLASGDSTEPIPVDMCARVVSVQVYATYRGHGVLVDDMDEAGTARVMEAEWDGEWATVNGFLHENKYEYFKTVDVTDLRDYYEKQVDLLFGRWRSVHFSRPIEGHPLGGGWANGRPAIIDGRPRSGLLETEDGRPVEVTTRAEYFGHPCEIAGITADGAVGLYYLGKDSERAEADGFEPDENGRWARAVHIYDLARYQEHHADLYFDTWLRGRGNR